MSGKKDKEYLDLEDEMLIDAVNKVFKEHPHDKYSKLSELRFTFCDDEGISEEEEEKRAIPETVDQKYLVAYFEGQVELTEKVLVIFQREKSAEHTNPNYPLIRKYFKQGNKRLKALLKFGLYQNPADDDFLSDFAFFHESSPMLRELIALYTNACKLEKDIRKFKTLAHDFYLFTEPDGFDALYALKEIFPSETAKGAVIDRIRAEFETSSPEVIEF